ncbi:unnamed protein product [Didymodactylos carnosus]|uniref:Peroxin-19 n=1 Tax=Didymodactylos carnosus TaxID=1234261 RepID=A0A814H569_9BILA|nr:unnamed protein product [Didymodactylos carnosus]CAF1005044.1 unnamed protein product [Didymodactylos carnosus]CAF3690042.1 unnamed protein product [Didymodactylos carnosus]CAF3776390.1 unnamed protein product [Didymodactylos carnosus]
MSELTSTTDTNNGDSEKKEPGDQSSLINLLDDAFNDFKNNDQKLSTESSTTVTATTADNHDDSITKSTTTTTTSESSLPQPPPPPPSDPLQTAFEAFCFNDEKFLNELDNVQNNFSSFPFGFGESTSTTGAGEGNVQDENLFNVFMQLGRHADLLQKIKDEDIEKALDKLASVDDQQQPQTSSQTQASTANESDQHIQHLNSFMTSILSKDVMLPACQAVAESYDDWLNKNKSTLKESDYERYQKQYDTVKEICQEYESSAANNSDDKTQLQRVLHKFQQLQTYGDPPNELMFFPNLLSGASGGSDTMFTDMFADADKVGQNDSDCCIM